MFNIIIRRAAVATAGAGIALALMAAPASAAPKADRGERQGTTAHTTQDQQNSTADVTVTVDCDNVVTVTSDKDISHVEWHLADGTTEKKEGLSGGTWTRTFDQDVVWAKAKSGETVVYGYPECDESQTPESNDSPDEDDNDVKNDDDEVGDDNAKDDDKKDDNDVETDDTPDVVEVGGDDQVNQPAAPGGDGTPSAVAPEAFKCGEAMAADVNGDGTIDAADCTKVLGVQLERGPAAPVAAPAVAGDVASARPGAQVLGVQFEQAPAALARTGTTFAPMLLGAIVLIVSGLAMVHGRRRSKP